MSSSLVPLQVKRGLARFGEVDIEIVDFRGEAWTIANRVADAMGASRTAFNKLINQMRQRGELRETIHFKYIVLEAGSTGPKEMLCLSHRGVIRCAMRADAPRAKDFRDWAEVVLFRVMTTGHYETPAYQTAQLANLSDFVNQLTASQSKLIESQARLAETLITLSTKVSQIENTRETVNAVSERSLREFFTPSQWAYAAKGESLPKFFNQGGRFDYFAAERYFEQFGKVPEQRKYPLIRGNKRPEFLIPNTSEMHQFMEGVLTRFLHEKVGTQLTIANLLPIALATRRLHRMRASSSTLPRHRRG